MDSPSAHEQTSSVTVEHFMDQFLLAVCDSRRRHILAYLTTVSEHEASPVERSVGKIAAHLKVAMSTTSKHLKQLLEMHLVLARKEGKKTRYRIRKRELVQPFHNLIRSLEADYHHTILSTSDNGSPLR